MLVAAKAASYTEASVHQVRRYDSELVKLCERYDNVWIISITGADRKPLYGEMSNVLPVYFDDVTADSLYSKAITDAVADKMVAFIEKAHAQQGRALLLAHCTAGVSRSGAVVDFVQTICGIPWEEFKAMNPAIKPNSMVKRKLMEAYGRVHPELAYSKEE